MTNSISPSKPQKPKTPKAKPSAAKRRRNNARTAKTAFLFLLFCISVPLGLWLASVIFALMAKLPFSMLSEHPLLILDYYAQYGDTGNAKVQKAFKAGFFAAAAVAVLIPCIAAMLIQKRKSLHGEAKFANSTDIAEMGLFKAEPTGILLGKLGRRFLSYIGNQFVMLAAATRSGKGVGLVIPNLLNYQHSVVVLDIKDENFEITAGWRSSKLKQKVYRFSPFTAKTHRWNPLDFISDDVAKQVTEIIQLAYMLYPDPEDPNRSNFFEANSRALFVGIVGLLKSVSKLPNGLPVKGTMGEVLRFGSGEAIHEYITHLLEWYEKDGKEHIKLNSQEIPTTYRDNLLFFANQSDDTRSSIWGTFTSPLNLWQSKYIDNATSASDFDFRRLRREKITLYVHIPPANLPEARIMLNIFYSQLVMANLDMRPEQDKTLKYQCCLMMDEFTAAGRVDIIGKSIAYIAGYNLRLVLIVQNRSQLVQAYGREGANSILGNVDATIIYTPADDPPEDAKDYSDMLGYHSIKGRSATRSAKSRSQTESEQRRALMLPQELRQMPLDDEIITMRGKKPVYADKIEYWTDKAFAGRIRLPCPAVPEWDIVRFIRNSESVEIVAETREAVEKANAEWIDGFRQLVDSITDDMTAEQQAEKFAEIWAENQNMTLDEARKLLASLDETSPVNEAEAERQQRIGEYGYDVERWGALDDYDEPNTEDEAGLLPPDGDGIAANEDERGNTAEDGMNEVQFG